MHDWTVEPLGKHHERADFACGDASLDDFSEEVCQPVRAVNWGRLTSPSLVDSRASWATTHWPRAISSSFRAPAELLKGLPKHPLPSLLLARLAVTQSERGQGLGKFLLFDAFKRCLRVAREVAFRAIEVEAIDDRAAAFYGKYGFLPFPSDPHHLTIAMETVEEVLGG